MRACVSRQCEHVVEMDQVLEGISVEDFTDPNVNQCYLTAVADTVGVSMSDVGVSYSPADNDGDLDVSVTVQVSSENQNTVRASITYEVPITNALRDCLTTNGVSLEEEPSVQGEGTPVLKVPDPMCAHTPTPTPQVCTHLT